MIAHGDKVVDHRKSVLFWDWNQQDMCAKNMEVSWRAAVRRLSESCEIKMEPTHCTKRVANCHGPWQLCGCTVGSTDIVVVRLGLLILELEASTSCENT